MKNFKELIDFYRICKICNKKDTDLTISNQNRNLKFDFFDDELRIFLSYPIFIKINVLTNDKNIYFYDDLGMHPSNYEESTIKNDYLYFRSECLICKSIKYSTSAHINDSMKPSDFKFFFFKYTKNINEVRFNIFIENNELIIYKYVYGNEIYSYSYNEKDYSYEKFNSLDIEQLIDKHETLQIFT